MRYNRFDSINRHVCDVLDEMRKCYETKNFSSLLGLIEEAQTMYNRMEASLWNQKDYENAEIRYKELKKKIKALQKEIEEKEEE